MREPENMQDESQKNQTAIQHDQLDIHVSEEEDFSFSEELSKETGDVEFASDDSQFGKKREKRKSENPGSFSSQFEAFKKEFDAQSEGEAKLQLVIKYMEESLAQGGTPHFRSFWEARRLCLPLFKENISIVLRGQLWTKYSELSKEARRLKEILDEQSSFAIEQIEIAIQALESEITQFDEHVEKSTFLEIASYPEALKEYYPIYQKLQKQLNLLNTQASRINALRKELLKTDMRVRHKNKFFQRLSVAGDKVFPKRKDLIKQISQQFTQDVDQFINQHFGEMGSRETFYVLREEIKSFQGLAKILTLNTHSFTYTRTRLSECWDRIKVEEKERKKERAQQRVVFKQNFEEIEKQIRDLKEAFEKNNQTGGEVQKNIEKIISQMRQIELGRDELKILRESLNELRNLIRDKAKKDENDRLELEKERNFKKREKYQTLKDHAEKLLREHEELEADQLTVQREDLLTQIQEAPFSKTEKQELERVLKPLRDAIAEKKEKALLALSDDDRQSLQQMQNILKQRKERRQEIKNQLEVLRKAVGSSSLDFEKAMNYTAQINEEKERLEKANQAIVEVELKITEMKERIRN